MNKYTVRLTPEAEEDLALLYTSLTLKDVISARKALIVIKEAFKQLALFPYSCRKEAKSNNPYLREMIIPFGSSGYVALFEIEPDNIVTILSVRHQRQDDYL